MNISAKPVALVTGASSGIGKDFAHRLIDEGYVVYGAARRTDRMDGIKAAGGHVIALDVTDDTSIIACVTQILSEQNRIDVLINNAGYGQYGALEDVPIDEGRRQMETNLIGCQGSQRETPGAAVPRRRALQHDIVFAPMAHGPAI